MDVSYGQFCPVAMGAEIFCSRWTALVVREMLCGSTRFNDLRRGVPRMSPALLSKRLKELEAAGVIETSRNKGSVEYRLTPAGEDMRGVVMALGSWGQRWIESDLSLKNLDPTLLMWDMRRNLDPTPLPPKRSTIQFKYVDVPPARQNFWLIVDGRSVDVCAVDPGNDVDLFVTSTLRAMTAIWMGHSTLAREMDKGNIELTGDRHISQTMQQWLGLSPFAKEKSRAAA